MLETRFHDGLDEIPASAWNALVAEDNPFVSHAFLRGLESHGCIRGEWGWRPHHLGLYRADRLVAAAPLYLKYNSRGEYVFDWGWANAWENAGGRYYPKLLNAVPWSPVTGPRLLVGASAAAATRRRALVRAMQDTCLRLGLASLHANFLPAEDAAAFGPEWLSRSDIQFHWHNRGYGDFDDFLATLRHRKRKNIRQERAQAARTGLALSFEDGADLGRADWQTLHALYESTFARKGNFGVLSAEFLYAMAHHPDLALKLALAREGKQIVAMALFLQSHDTLYGRYWGCRAHYPGLHFELCYYLGIEHCIRAGLSRFEPGAQGEHKMARGFTPTRTHSRHFLPNASFRAAVAAALRHEDAAVTAYLQELEAHSAYAHIATESTV